MADAKAGKIVYLKTLSHKTHIHMLQLFLQMKQLLTYGEITFGGHVFIFYKLPLNHYGTKHKTMATRVLYISSIYCLNYFKTCCQDYTQKYDKIELMDIYRRNKIAYIPVMPQFVSCSLCI